MSKRIKITAGSLVVDAELNDTRTASAVWDALPIQANGSTWILRSRLGRCAPRKSILGSC
ncbi:hypothetical protein M1N45_02245 [Dehalococcoidia bacterium]|nr:hypothetical protein [Dehalococcoidia bacterium]